MGNLVIVAIPQADDPVWKISSEKVPHLTILHMGPSQNEAQIALFLEHAAKLALPRFELDVDRRGILGADNADVLFFRNSWEMPRLKTFRDLLLKEPNIKTAYDSVEQFTVPQDWLPHLTLGYPTAPAKQTSDPTYWVRFDRVALWTGDYSGPEFTLDQLGYDDMEVGMSDTSTAGQKFLTHHGVLGMKWGRRKAEGPTAVTTTPTHTAIRGKAKVKTSGGEGQPAHPDAIVVAAHRQKMVKSGMAALSNSELQDMQTRLQLETNVARLHGESQTQAKGKKFIKKLGGDYAKGIGQEGVNQAVRSSVKAAKK